MAPELALAALEGLAPGSHVLDPMAGSGTVLRHASFAGHKAIGFDLDPLAVLISRVSSRKVDIEKVESLCEDILDTTAQLGLKDAQLPWMDNCEETTQFVAYWFGKDQRNVLRKLAYALREAEYHAVGVEKRHVDVLKVALSRIIITKESGASLARDVSHSRPHRVRESSDYDVIKGFQTSTAQVVRFLEDGLPARDATVKRGDARRLNSLDDASIDIVITSPPYLNAIDYLRGHKLSLVWFGYTLGQIRQIRSDSIGSERALQVDGDQDRLRVESAMVNKAKLLRRHRGMVSRYATDILRMVREISRVLKPSGKAVLVVGDCCVSSEFISNSSGIKEAASIHGLQLVSRTSRDLPSNSRYLPITATNALSKRLRTENVLTFCPA
jgi:SAM-dependent methyltransferase